MQAAGAVPILLVMGRQGRRHKQLLDDRKQNKVYSRSRVVNFSLNIQNACCWRSSYFVNHGKTRNREEKE